MIIYSFEEWWATLTGPEQIYWTIAIAASIVFFVVFVLNLILGFDTDTDVDADVDVDVDVDVDTDVEVDTSITLFSIKGITAFFTFFGWAGVLFLNDGRSVMISTVFAFVAGTMALILVGYLMNFFANMGESGNFSIDEALNKTGEVYLTIPPSVSGKGKIQIELGGGIKEVKAISDEGEIKTGEKILVTDIIDQETLMVKRIKDE